MNKIKLLLMGLLGLSLLVYFLTKKTNTDISAKTTSSSSVAQITNPLLTKPKGAPTQEILDGVIGSFFQVASDGISFFKKNNLNLSFASGCTQADSSENNNVKKDVCFGCFSKEFCDDLIKNNYSFISIEDDGSVHRLKALNKIEKKYVAVVPEDQLFDSYTLLYSEKDSKYLKKDFSDKMIIYGKKISDEMISKIKYSSSTKKETGKTLACENTKNYKTQEINFFSDPLTKLTYYAQTEESSNKERNSLDYLIHSIGLVKTDGKCHEWFRNTSTSDANNFFSESPISDSHIVAHQGILKLDQEQVLIMRTVQGFDPGSRQCGKIIDSGDKLLLIRDCTMN